MLMKETNNPDGVLIVDDTGFPKKGTHSVCVSRQYCGARGKIDNCQIGVSLTYAGNGIAWPYSMEMFVPKSWDTDDEVCKVKRKQTGMPEEARYKSKWEMALELMDTAEKEGLLFNTVLADAWYGNIHGYRQGLVDRGKKYVVGVYANTPIFLEEPVFAEEPKSKGQKKKSKLQGNPPITAQQLSKTITEEQWEILELREGSDGKPLVAEAVTFRVYPATGYRNGEKHEEAWLIIERRKHIKGGYENRFYFSNTTSTMPTIDLAKLVHERYWIEHGYQQLKEELGLDHHEGRSWQGWHRHVLFVFLSFAFLTLLRIEEKKRQQKETTQNMIRQAQLQKGRKPSQTF